MTTQQIKIYDEISSVESPASNLWEVDRCFSDSTLEWLTAIPGCNSNRFEVGGLAYRLQLMPDAHDQARLTEIGVSMCDQISGIVGQPLSFMESKFWIDLPPFGCQMHQDAEQIYVSYQVYIYSAIHDAIQRHENMPEQTADYLIDSRMAARGAEFHHVDPPHQIKFISNHGYINLNSDSKPHQVLGNWDVRTSVMFQYARV